MKFSIRDLFLVTMIVALTVGWWLDRRQLQEHERQATAVWRNRVDDVNRVLTKELGFVMVWDDDATTGAARKSPNSQAPDPIPPKP